MSGMIRGALYELLIIQTTYSSHPCCLCDSSVTVMSLCELQSEALSGGGRCALQSNKTQLKAGQPHHSVKLALVLFILSTSVVRTLLSFDG